MDEVEVQIIRFGERVTQEQAPGKMQLSMRNLETLCICALRYCAGRETYMPYLVQSIVRPLLPFFSDGQLQVLLDDCDFQRRFKLYGDEKIDKPGWLQWEQDVAQEIRRRKEAGKKE